MNTIITISRCLTRAFCWPTPELVCDRCDAPFADDWPLTDTSIIVTSECVVEVTTHCDNSCCESCGVLSIVAVT